MVGKTKGSNHGESSFRLLPFSLGARRPRETPAFASGGRCRGCKMVYRKDKTIEIRDEMVSDMRRRTEEIELELTSDDIKVSATVEKVTVTEGANTKTTMTMVKRDGIAFDHAEIILYSLERLRGKVNYTNIAFNLVGEEFTLPDLQQVYEVILGRDLNKVQFRRHVEDMVEDTGREIKTGAYRPSKLYKYNEDWVYDQWK